MEKLKNIEFSSVKFENGFWKYRYDLNKDVSLKSVYEQFEKTGRFDALRFNYQKDKKFYPDVYYDSDVAKWIEAVAYLIISNGGHNEEQKIIDALIDDMANNQLENGYLNSHYIQVAPQNIFTDRNMHELYCAGHLIEAAIAYDKATGKNKFLNIMLKYVDCIKKAFITEKTAKFKTCGHEEIELALVKLYEYTGVKEYLEIAEFFINERGVDEPSPVPESFNQKQIQCEVPVRKLEKAEGHAVRVVYLLIGMANLALKNNDKDLFDACKRVFRDIVDKKMYVTGSIGSCKTGESFTTSYDLPNLEAYSESCASIGLILFVLELQRSGLCAEYGHVIERVMYNGLLSSTSENGKEFFYENPLEIHLDSVGKETSVAKEKQTKLPIRHRLEVFTCSCCPPNINRIFARLGDVFFSESENDLIVNQYGALSLNNQKVCLKMITEYPNDGKVSIHLDRCEYQKIYLRIPEWCDNYNANGNFEIKDGYLVFDGKEKTIEVDFNMQPYYVECNPKARANVGRVALCYGPVVYCLERLDNDCDLNALSVDVKEKVTVGQKESYNMQTLCVKGFKDQEFSSLYRKEQGKKQEFNLLFKPYWTFANREECDMIIWVRKK